MIDNKVIVEQIRRLAVEVERQIIHRTMKTSLENRRLRLRLAEVFAVVVNNLMMAELPPIINNDNHQLIMEVLLKVTVAAAAKPSPHQKIFTFHPSQRMMNKKYLANPSVQASISSCTIKYR